MRTGFEHATGDFILIQDADLEYDLEDYDALLEPLRRGAKRSCWDRGTAASRLEDAPLHRVSAA